MSFGGRKLKAIGNYNLDGYSLGEGSFGKVELAHHAKTRTKVALKLIHLKSITNQYVKDNLQREARILVTLRYVDSPLLFGHTNECFLLYMQAPQYSKSH